MTASIDPSHDSPSSVPLVRVLDASANRAVEALRVVEDYVRFVLDDRHLTEIAKRMRHDLVEALRAVPHLARHRARDTRADVGTDVTTASESLRETTWSVAAASLKRLEQALRSLEEFSKVVDVTLAKKCEALRYEAYTLERATDITLSSQQRLADTQLYVLVDGSPSPALFVSLIESLLAGGVHAIQLRDKQLSDRQLLDRAHLLRKATAENDTLMIINDRADIAAVSHADGVHVGQDELTVKDARTILGTGALVGVSTHTIEQARTAVLDGADYLGVGPTFASTTKQFDEFSGLDFIRLVAAEISLPAFAIGGIHRENLSQVTEAGLHRVAVGAAVTQASDPAAAARELIELLHEEKQS